ncbi:MAG: hypothetical protein KA807_15375 [Prolixibacteraceae bacterium]|nr:hypothetical protein [Prolixibacteraceae bacterium]
MKVNFIRTILAIGISALVAYGFNLFIIGENKILLTIGSFILFVVTLLFTIGINFTLSRTTTNIRVVSTIFFAISILVNLSFSIAPFKVEWYIIFSGLILLIYLLIIYSIFNKRQ